MTRSAAKPWGRKKAARAHLSPDEQWAAEICARIDADCHPHQLAGVTDPARRVSFLIGRGGTKTSTLRARALKKLVSIRNADILYGALTRPSAEKLQWFKLKSAIFNYGLSDDFELSDYKMRAICKRTGAMYTLTGMQDDADIEGFRGQPFDEVQVDEAASHDPERLGRFIDEIVGPRLGERRGALVLAGTPGRQLRGVFYEATRPGSDRHRPYVDRDKPEYANWKGWSSHAWTLKDIVTAGPPDDDALDIARDAALEGRRREARALVRDASGITDYARERYPALCANYEEALVEKAEKRYSDENPVWLREWCGIWAFDDTAHVFQYRPEKDGKPWNQWDPLGEQKLAGLQALRAAIAALPTRAEGVELKDWRYVVAMDSGTTHPFAANVFAFAPADPTRTQWHVFGFERARTKDESGMHARSIADLCLGADFVDRMRRGQKVDHAKSEGLFGLTGWPDGMIFDADPMTLDELEREYGLRFAKADRNPNYKHGAIEATNGELVDGRIKVIKGSILEQQLQSLQWEEDRFGAVRPSRKQADHCTDCLIYSRVVIKGLWDSGAVVAEKPSRESVSQTVYRDPMGLDDDAPGEYDSLLARAEYGE